MPYILAMLLRYAVAFLTVSGVFGSMEIIVWKSEDCSGQNDLRTKLDLRLDVGCIKRGDVAQQLQAETLEDLVEEKAISAYQDGSTFAQSQQVVFFTSEDCDPDTEIEGGYIDDSCSNVREELKGDKWKSYEMRDACVGFYSGCDLDGPIEPQPSGPKTVCQNPNTKPDPKYGCPEDWVRGPELVP